MDEYISKTKFEELMRKKARNNFDLYYADKSKHYHDNAIGYNKAADEAHDFPSEDVQPVKHGKWIEVTPKHSRCSVCDTTCLIAVYPISKGANFCPNCGARMMKDGDAE